MFVLFPTGQVQRAGTTSKPCNRQHPCLAELVLHRCLLQCRYLGVAPSASQTYQLKSTFCHKFGISPVPASSLALEYFCVQASQHISYKTLKVYLSGIRLAHIERGLPDPTKSPSLHLVCRGIHRQQGDHYRTRLPITINLLRLLKQQLQICCHYTALEQHMLWALFTLAFYGFFRASELLSNLSWSDVVLSSNRISITLHQSKTDPFRRGQTIHIFESGSSTCPVRAMACYLNLVNNNKVNEPVFSAGRFTPLTQKSLNKVLRYLLQKEGLTKLTMLNTALESVLPLQPLLPRSQLG